MNGGLWSQVSEQDQVKIVDTIGLPYVLGGIIFCVVGGLMVRFSAEVADWQAHMHDGIRRATSGRERQLWDWAAQPYSDTDTNEALARGLGGVFVLAGFVVLSGYVARSLWRLWF